jgi:hypothetical protein
MALLWTAAGVAVVLLAGLVAFALVGAWVDCKAETWRE